MSKKVIIGPGENNLTIEDLTSSEVTDMENRQTANAAALATVKTDAANGNTKLLDLGLTQAEITAMTGFKPE